MKTEVLMFGIAREIAGEGTLQMNLKEGTTVGELRKALSARFPLLGDLKSFMIAKNSEYASDDQAITNADEIAIIPPVSGG